MEFAHPLQRDRFATMTELEKSLNTLFSRAKKNPEITIREWVSDLQVEPELLEKQQKLVAQFLLEVDFVRTLSSAGVATHSRFLEDLSSRIFQRFFPPVYVDNDFSSVLHRMEESRSDPSPLLEISDESFREFCETLAPHDPDLNAKLRSRIAEAMQILAIRVAGLGLSPRVSERLLEKQELRRSFLELSRETEAYILQPTQESSGRMMAAIRNCVESAKYIRDRRGSEGISLSITFQLNVIHESSRRLELLSKIHYGLGGQLSIDWIEQLIKEVLEAELRAPRIRQLISRYIGLVFFQITEHTSKAGEKYIAKNYKEWRMMLTKGLKGGLLVGLFAVLKPVASLGSFAPAVEALIYSLIYSFIFLGIFLTGGVLATKQPAMTASRLAKVLDQAKRSQSSIWRMSELVLLTFRSQTVAVLGNVFVALPIAALTSWVFILQGWSGLPNAKVDYLLMSLNPFERPSTLLYAFVTGIALSLTGIVAGAASNWFIFNKVPARLDKMLRRKFRFSSGFSQRISSWLAENVGGLSGNVVLGFVLGCLPIIGYVFGLPLDVRHVTFASAQIGTALAHLGASIPLRVFGEALLGTALIGLINLMVSFGITLFVVLSSRGITFTQSRKLLVLCLKRFLKEPKSYFFPSRKPDLSPEKSI